jgi:plasmid stabilization system protein ParE
VKLRLDVRPEAQADLLEARDWYKRRRAGLGDEFVDVVDELFARIAESPTLFAASVGDVRRAKLKRFPYVVYYRILAERLEVIGVLHGSRHSRVWQRRI